VADKRRFSFFGSLRFRILLVLLVIGAVPAAVASGAIVRNYKDRAVDMREMNVKNQCEILCDLLSEEGFFENTKDEALNARISLLSNIYNGRIIIVDSSFKVVKDTYDIDTGKTSVTGDVLSCFTTRRGTSEYDDKNAYIVMTYPIEERRSNDVEGVMLVSVSTNEIEQNAKILESRAGRIMIGIMIAVAAVGLIASYLLVRPITRVTRTIDDVAEGIEEEAAVVRDYTETVQITTGFNKLLKKVKNVDSVQTDFISNVSHELKTPLTSMKILADSVNSMDEVPTEIYKEFMEDISSEIDRETRIIADLRSMVQLDKNASSFNPERTEIGQLLRTLIKVLRPIARQRDIQLILDAPHEVYAEVDGSKLSFAFSNLIENGIKYNIDHGWVRTTLESDSKYFYVTVTDCGIGISEEQQSHVFERFYRGDTSHSTKIEGSGLGLAIARSSIVLHRGSISVASKQGEGTSFKVRIPLVHQEKKEKEKPADAEGGNA